MQLFLCAYPMCIIGPSGPTGRPEATAARHEKNLAIKVFTLKMCFTTVPFKNPINSGSPDAAAAGLQSCTQVVLKSPNGSHALEELSSVSSPRWWQCWWRQEQHSRAWQNPTQMQSLDPKAHTNIPYDYLVCLHYYHYRIAQQAWTTPSEI